MESFRVPTTSKADIAARFTTEGIHHMLDALADGRGAILALPHLGGWEWAGRWVADQGIPITVVVEPLDPPELFEWFVGYRRSLGMQVVPVGLGAAMASIKALRSNGVLCLLCDRDIGTGGVEVEFFGERTKLPAGPATLALRTGAPILPTAVYYEAGGLHVGSVGAPIEIERRGSPGEDIAALTQALAYRVGGADPRRARAVASVPTELAERPRLWGVTWTAAGEPGTDQAVAATQQRSQRSPLVVSAGAGGAVFFREFLFGDVEFGHCCFEILVLELLRRNARVLLDLLGLTL